MPCFKRLGKFKAPVLLRGVYVNSVQKGRVKPHLDFMKNYENGELLWQTAFPAKNPGKKNLF